MDRELTPKSCVQPAGGFILVTRSPSWVLTPYSDHQRHTVNINNIFPRCVLKSLLVTAFTWTLDILSPDNWAWPLFCWRAFFRQQDILSLLRRWIARHTRAHLYLCLCLTELIFVTDITNYIRGEKIVMWRNFSFPCMTIVGKLKISPHV